MRWKTMTYLLLGNLFWLVANGRWSVFPMAWLFPCIVLLFLHTTNLWRGVAWLYVTNYAVQVVSWQGLIPIPGVGYYLAMLGFTAYYILPFVLDRWLRPRTRGLAQTLVLPLGAVAIDFAISFSPYGTNGALAYSQYDFPQILQIMSVTGIWGLTFLLFWLGSLGYHVYEHRQDLRGIRSQLIVPALVYAFVLAVGFVRFGRGTDADTVRFSSFTADMQPLWQALDRQRVDLTQNQPLSNESTTTLNQFYDDYFSLARSIRTPSTRMVMSSEANLPVEKEREVELVQRAARFSRDNAVSSVHGFVVYTKGNALAENKLLVFDASGRQLAEYFKAFIVPGDANVQRDKQHQTIQLAGKKVGLSICFDMDFPQWVQQYGRDEVSLVLSPASDWRDVDPYHARMAVFRAVENGFSLIRQTNKGRSLAVDGRRRVYGETDFFEQSPHVMQADVPLERLTAWYPYTYDAFAWLSVLGLLCLLVRRRRDGRQPRTGG